MKSQTYSRSTQRQMKGGKLGRTWYACMKFHLQATVFKCLLDFSSKWTNSQWLSFLRILYTASSTLVKLSFAFNLSSWKSSGLSTWKFHFIMLDSSINRRFSCWVLPFITMWAAFLFARSLWGQCVPFYWLGSCVGSSFHMMVDAFILMWFQGSRTSSTLRARYQHWLFLMGVTCR